ncbi:MULTISPECIES: MFS transporter [Acidithrix]|uniref:Major facilitator superfamily protein n=1 Tax=Acidithrix ferrooxidans TaxID=1280514 RepID=A0A0D8HIB7_9ACTN|nr:MULTISPECIES: MFS transporter [Acidithrix]KJF17730.1 major facilitator superfamily protein [Acidithrix ferrooxidans]
MRPFFSVASTKVRDSFPGISFGRLGLANVARVPIAMAPLALVISEGKTKSALAMGSFMVSAFTIGEIFLSSRLAKLGDSIDPNSALIRLLFPLIFIWGLFGVLSSHVSNPIVFGVLALSSLLIGGIGAGLFGISRNIVLDGPKVLKGSAKSRDRLISLDTSLMEVFFLVSPIVVSFAVVLGGSAFGAIVTSFVSLGGLGVAFYFKRSGRIETKNQNSNADSTVLRGSHPFEGGSLKLKSKGESVWFSKSRLWIFLASAGEGVAEGGLIIAIPSILLENHQSVGFAGVAIAMISLGSITGGTVATAFSHSLSRIDIRVRLALFLLGLSGGVVVLTTLHSLLSILIATFIAGLFVAPINTARALAIGATVSEGQNAEAFGALYGSYSIGFALIGLILGIFGTSVPAASLLGATAFLSLLIALYLMLTRRSNFSGLSRTTPTGSAIVTN